MYGYIKSNELSGYCIAHHGILGQKWGIRRYQNEDGSLTEIGRKRYGNPNSHIGLNKRGLRTRNIDQEKFAEQRHLREINIEKQFKEEDRLQRLSSREKRNELSKHDILSKSSLTRPNKYGDRFYRYSEKERVKKAQDLALKAMKKMDMSVDSFKLEESTDGMMQIADLAMQGYSKAKIKKVLEASNDFYDYDKYPDMPTRGFDPKTEYGYDALNAFYNNHWKSFKDEFIDNCIKIYNKESHK